MTKDEYVKTLEKVAADNAVNAKHDDYYDGYFDGLKKAIKLTKELDEPKKVVIPQFIADWIEKAKVYYGDEIDPLRIIDWVDDHISSIGPHYEWMYNIDNQKLLLNAIANGYEVEKEPKYLVKIKGIGLEEEWLNCVVGEYTLYFELDSKLEAPNIKNAFTKNWLKDNWSEYDAYNNAGLLEFEEVEDE